MPRPTNANDIALGLAATGVRAGAAAGRLALLPVRLAARAPLIGPVLRRAGEELSSDGLETRARSRERLEAGAGDLLAAPEVERAVDQALAGPLTDTVARSLAKHRVAERVAAEIAATPEFEQAVADALDHEATQRLVDRALASPGLERLVIEALESRLTAEVVEHVATSPAVRSAMQRQTATLAEELMSGVRSRAEQADDAAQQKIRRRPVADAPYAGIATRGVGLAIDVLLAQITFLTGAALVGLVASLVGDLRPEWLVAALAGVGWILVSGTYFVLFWTAAGQTPGMRLMRLRVSDQRGHPPSLWRSVVRFFGLLLAIVPLFAGFLPVLFDDRRRGLQDFLAGTTVLYVDREPLIGEIATATDGGPAAAAKLSH
jgi:uncharacterized RDD family membrane protein YckC